jgi:hypothetical protein
LKVYQDAMTLAKLVKDHYTSILRDSESAPSHASSSKRKRETEEILPGADETSPISASPPRKSKSSKQSIQGKKSKFPAVVTQAESTPPSPRVTKITVKPLPPYPTSAKQSTPNSKSASSPPSKVKPEGGSTIKSKGSRASKVEGTPTRIESIGKKKGGTGSLSSNEIIEISKSIELGDLHKLKAIFKKNPACTPNMLLPANLFDKGFTWSPLHMAAYYGKNEIIDFLMEVGGDVEAEVSYFYFIFCPPSLPLGSEHFDIQRSMPIS